MKRAYIYPIIFAVFCLFAPFSLKAQIGEGGIPRSFIQSNRLKSESAPLNVPVDFSVEDLKEVDAWRVRQGAPLCVSKLIDVKLDLYQNGIRLRLEDGTIVQRLRLQAKGAIGLMLYYSKFYIPEGGKLFIYNAERNHLLGAYTSATHRDNGKFATEFVAGDDLIMEYEEGPDGAKPSIQIEEVGYGYNHLYINEARRTGPGASSFCQVDVNCEEGEEWQKQKDGVCQMVQKIGGKGWICSASLVNNTKQDFTPYILSAFHCSQDGNNKRSTKEEFEQWTFKFHFELDKCGRASSAHESVTLVGCEKIAESPTSGGSDGLLLKLLCIVPDSLDLYYNGWSVSTEASKWGVGIHHPAGDYMKISTYTTAAKTKTWNTSYEVGMRNADWNVIYRKTANGHSVTEGGSSGSPLFNADGLIVGTLTGGSSQCDSLPEGDNLYGKLLYHWDKYSTLTDSTRMDIWLDPVGKGSITSLEGKYKEPILSNESKDLVDSGNQISLRPSLFADRVEIVSAESVRRVEVISMEGKVVMSEDRPDNILITSSLSSGAYIFRFYLEKGGYPVNIKAIKR